MGPEFPQVPLNLRVWSHIAFSWGRETLNVLLFRDHWNNRSQCPKALKAGKSEGSSGAWKKEIYAEQKQAIKVQPKHKGSARWTVVHFVSGLCPLQWWHKAPISMPYARVSLIPVHTLLYGLTTNGRLFCTQELVWMGLGMSLLFLWDSNDSAVCSVNVGLY